MGRGRGLFDVYLAVDWSARSAPSPVRPSPDSVWVAECAAGSDTAPDRMHAHYLRTRYECEQWLRQRLVDHVDRGRRVLVGFDFPFGHPRGFAAALRLAGPGDAAARTAPQPSGWAYRRGPAPWRLIWDELDLLVKDAPGNGNNRFEVAAALNQRCGPAPGPGPLWGCPPGLAGHWLQPTSPGFPYQAGGLSLPRLRCAEQQVRGTQSAWKLMGIGSAGSQCLLGIPVVSRLRSDPKLAEVSRVWPFETRLTGSPEEASGGFVLHAEVWPGILRRHSRLDDHSTADRNPRVPTRRGPAFPTQSGRVKDEVQVRAVVRWLRSQDGCGGLGALLAAPDRLPPSIRHDVLAEEGWILGG